MTTSSAYGFNMTGADVVKTAFRLAGILSMEVEPSPAQLSVGLGLLNVTLKALQNEGVVLATIERVTTTTSSGTATYTADPDTIDVRFPAYCTLANTTNTNVIEQMHLAAYMQLSDRAIQGIPTQMYVEQNGTAYSLNLYPVPDANIASFTYARVRLLKDMDASGASTPDLAARWLKFLTYDLAHDIALASSLSASKAQYLKGLAMKERAEAEGYDNEGGDIQWVPSHAGGWRGF